MRFVLAFLPFRSRSMKLDDHRQFGLSITSAGTLSTRSWGGSSGAALMGAPNAPHVKVPMPDVGREPSFAVPRARPQLSGNGTCELAVGRFCGGAVRAARGAAFPEQPNEKLANRRGAIALRRVATGRGSFPRSAAVNCVGLAIALPRLVI